MKGVSSRGDALHLHHFPTPFSHPLMGATHPYTDYTVFQKEHHTGESLGRLDEMAATQREGPHEYQSDFNHLADSGNRRFHLRTSDHTAARHAAQSADAADTERGSWGNFPGEPSSARRNRGCLHRRAAWS